MSKFCEVKSCVFYGRYCRLHPSGELKKPKPIKPRSKKLDKIMRKEYVPQVKEMVAKGTLCVVNSPECGTWAQGFHHLKGRGGKGGKDLVGKKKVPCCNRCNQFIEQNDAWARANGWKLSKFKKD